MVEAADLFNASDFRRTVAGIAKSLGEPRVEHPAPLRDERRARVTVAWDISWYQYRVSPDRSSRSGSPSAAMSPASSSSTFTRWNARLDADGRVVPDIARV